MATTVGVSVSLPVWSPLFSDSGISVIVMVTLEPAGMMTRPRASVTSELTVVVTISPFLLVRELISRSTAVGMIVPEARASGAGAGSGSGAGWGLGFGLGFGLVATGLGGGAAA